jgi:hypothetical protein
MAGGSSASERRGRSLHSSPCDGTEQSLHEASIVWKCEGSEWLAKPLRRVVEGKVSHGPFEPLVYPMRVACIHEALLVTRGGSLAQAQLPHGRQQLDPMARRCIVSRSQVARSPLLPPRFVALPEFREWHVEQRLCRSEPRSTPCNRTRQSMD